MKFKKIKYSSLNPKQQEIYNFQKVSAVLADYGFNCIKLNDDWQGADFLAYHKDGKKTLKVQLKGRLTIDKKYVGKDIYITFPLDDKWCVIPHDHLVEIVGQCTPWLKTNSWRDVGCKHSGKPSTKLKEALKKYIIG